LGGVLSLRPWIQQRCGIDGAIGGAPLRSFSFMSMTRVVAGDERHGSIHLPDFACRLRIRSR
jgi:hypothetical protein